MNKLLLYVGWCLVLASLGSATLLIQEPSFGDEFAFDASPRLSWDGCDADSYFVQIATDGLFDSMVFQQAVTSTSYDLEFDLSPDTYFIRVNAIGDDGAFSCTSPTVEFYVKQLLPLSFVFDTSEYADDDLLKVKVHGPPDAKVSVDISSTDGFELPMVLDGSSNFEFEVVLPSSFYTFDAFSDYADGTLEIEQTLALEVSEPTAVASSQSSSSTDDTLFDGTYNLSVEVLEFEGEPVAQGNISIFGNETNYTLTLNDNGNISLLLEEGEYQLFFEKEGYTPKKSEITLNKNKSITLTVVDLSKLDDVIEVNETEKEPSIIPLVSLKKFEKSAYASSYVPIIFHLNGSVSRCQVLTKDAQVESYEIAESVLNPSAVNEVVLTKLLPGEIDIRIRCILSSDKAIISKTQTISLIDIEKDISLLEESIAKSQKIINKINGFPISFKQVFIDEIIALEGFLSSSRELLKEAKSSDDLIVTKKKISELQNDETVDVLNNIVVDDSQSVISYANADEVDLVRTYLDLSKSTKKLLEEQELFAIKTNYNFVTLTYTSGLTIKQTFVSSQVIPVEGTDADIAFDEYFVMSSFLTSRLSPSNDMLVKSYGEHSLVRLLENSSALIFDGWVDDTSLIKTVILTDAQSMSSSPTGFAINDVSIPDWKIPLISFVIIIIVAGLFFNPYYSVLDAFEKDHLGAFTSKVNECIDCSVSGHHDKVIQLVPKILDVHEKMSSQEKIQAQGIITNVRELFYEATYNLTLTKISSKPAHLWSYPELEMAIKDFYSSYAKLPPTKQNAYRPYFNQMLDYCQQLLSQVKK